jgi:hypothetical protein
MTQSKLGSFIETVTNTAIGYFIALASQLVLFPLFDIHVPMRVNFALTAWFTVISVARGYVLRRWFNARLHRVAQKLAGGSEE